MPVHRIALRLLVVLLALASFVYLVHGANQLGIFSGLLLSGEAWDDESKGLAFMVLGGVGVCLSGTLLVLWHVQQLRREIGESRPAERVD